MTEKIITSEFKTNLIKQLTESIGEPANTIYYAFIGNHIPYDSGDSSIPVPTNSNEDIQIDVFRNMMCGKKIDTDDLKIMVPRYDWTSGQVYDCYDDADGDLFTKPFYTVVDETAYFHVYKCLYNANGAPSNSQPTFTDVTQDQALFSNGDSYYETSDGYQWKYMYSVDSVTWNKFATNEFMPVVANAAVVNTAINGSIDVIKITDHGVGYNNYIDGKFSAADIKYGGNTVQYTLTTGANTQTGFYANTIMQLMDGTGAGQFRSVVNSFSTGDGVVAVVNSGFTTVPDATTTYQLSPEVRVSSDGSQTTNVVARAIINATSSNSVHRVEVIEPGAGYSYAFANVLVGTAETAVTAQAIVKPIIPPAGGHGHDAEYELGGSAVCFYSIFANNESGQILTDNDFRQFGIIQDPLFSNVAIDMTKVSDGNTAGSDGTFVDGETIYQFRKVKLHSNVSITSGNNIVAANEPDAEYSECISESRYLYVVDKANNDHFFTGVQEVPNGDHVVCTTDAPFTSNNCEMFLARLNVTAVVKDVLTTSVLLDKVQSGIQQDQLMVGGTSYAVANISGIDIHNKYNNNYLFDTFEQLQKYEGTLSSGSFIEDEVCSYTSNGQTIATGRVYVANTTTLALTNITGTFITGINIIGNDSGAVFAVTNKYQGDLDQTEGHVIYLQNDLAVSRSNTQSEEIRVILEF